MERLFFAIWPDAASAAKLEEVARELALEAGGRPMRAARIHLTIAFLGSVEADRAAAARAAGEAVRAPACDFVVDRVGSFRGARVAWAGCGEPPPGLVRLHEALAGQLDARGFALEERGFAPHATLVRGIRRPVERSAIDAIGWRARALTLVRSELGKGEYRVLAGWPLEGG
jgi:2'-5' RNA ligase